MNYEHIFWRFWKPHSFEASKHSYNLYFKFNNKMVGLISRKLGKIDKEELYYLRIKRI